MAETKQTQLAATGLGLITVGAGAGFALLPRLFGWVFGMRKPSAQEGGSQLVVRALGFRDIAFGLGLLAARDQPDAARQWLRFYTVCMVGDVIACLLAYLKPGRTPFQLLGGLASVGFGAWAWLSSQK